jgi:S1-C subfamily serine protease
MNSAVKIIKRGQSKNSTGALAITDEQMAAQGTREIVKTVKGWISELQQRRRDEQVRSSAFRKVGVIVSLLILSFCGLGSESEGQQLRDAFHKVEDAVVVVRTEQQGLAPFPQQGMVSLNGLGSGVLISNDKVLTAAHLVQAADRTMVEFSRGELIPARVIGSALSADIALLQLEHSPANAAPATLGNSDKLDVGDQIFVVGAPYGLSQTLTAGHISGHHSLDEKSENTTAVEFLQTDAAINSGNSGSPVFSLNGEVMGIVSNIMSKSGGSEGMAFAATSNTARRLLLDQKPFWSGIEGLVIDGDLARALNLPQPAGVLVQRVAEGSIASRWGIHAGKLRANVEGEEFILGGDVILRVNDVPVEQSSNYDDIYASMGQLKPGENLVISVFRQGQIVKLSIPTTQ